MSVYCDGWGVVSCVSHMCSTLVKYCCFKKAPSRYDLRCLKKRR